MTEKNGLGASIWASGSQKTHTFTSAARLADPRARSVPPRPLSASDTPPARDPVPASISASAPSLGLVQALHRLEQTCLRLRWKSLDLDSSWRRVDPSVALSSGFDPGIAERNFKLDFYEFYTWIEQAIVLLQRIFGIEILPGSGGRGRMHAYHHNVLTALSDEDNPLHGVLGRGDVNHALWKAKDLRNKWKDEAGDGSTDTPPTRMYDLQWIVGMILAGLEEAYGLARQRVVELGQSGMGEMDGLQVDRGRDDAWDWMVDEPMDWEA